MTGGAGPLPDVRGRLMLAFPGVELPPAMERRLREAPAAGITLFRYQNVDTPGQVCELVGAVQVALAAGGHEGPLLIAADQEGGQLVALGDGTTAFPGSMALAATGDVDLARRVGRATGEELLAMGVNVAYAPSCDLASNPANPHLGIRSFGDDPAVVGAVAAAMTRGLRDAGVAVTVKHFPGLGEADLDSHHALPVLALDRARLDAVELVPFAAAIEAGADLVMSAHVALPALTGEPTLPATLSHEVLVDLLGGGPGLRRPDDHRRARNGRPPPGQRPGRRRHRGDQGGRGPAAVRAGPGQPRAHRRRRGPRREPPPVRRAGPARVSGPPHGTACPARSGTPARPRRGRVRRPPRPRPRGRRAVDHARPRGGRPAPAPARSGRARARGHAGATRAHPGGHLVIGRAGAGRRAPGVGAGRGRGRDVAPADGRRDRGRRRPRAHAAVVVVGTISASADPAQARLAASLLATGCPVVTVALRTPWDLCAYPSAGTHVVAYGILPPTMRALACALMGAIPFRGRLPVRLDVREDRARGTVAGRSSGA